MLEILLFGAIELILKKIYRAAEFPLSYNTILPNLYFIILHIKIKDNGAINTMAINLMEHFLVLQGCLNKQSLIFGISR